MISRFWNSGIMAKKTRKIAARKNGCVLVNMSWDVAYKEVEFWDWDGFLNF